MQLSLIMEDQSFVIILRPSNNYGIENTEAIINEHFQYLQDQMNNGKLIMAGRFSEVLIGLVIIETTTRLEALEIMKNDPAVKAGVFHAELYPWRIALKA